jgi:hypothetical protein
MFNEDLNSERKDAKGKSWRIFSMKQSRSDENRDWVPRNG